MEKKRSFEKVIGVFVLVMSVMFFAVGCGGGNVTINQEQLAQNLLNNVRFDTELSQLGNDDISDFVNIDEGTEGIMYMGNGSYADSFGIFTCADTKSAGKTKETVQEYLSGLRASFEDYIPEEAGKIQDGILMQKGQYVVFCITADVDNASKIIDAAFEGSEGEQNAEEEQNGGTDQNEEGDDGEQTDLSDKEEPEEASYAVLENDGEVQKFGGVILVGDTAYELYSYKEDTAEKYAECVNRVQAELDGEADVYDIIIPLSSQITLPDRLWGEISSSNQQKAMDKLYGLMNDGVNKVNIYDNLMRHRAEYIYFRTDHHWTALGAYYAYEEFCKAKGIQPTSLEEHKTITFDGFLGSFYNDTKKPKALKDAPDTIEAYYPISENTKLQYTTEKGKTIKWDIIKDVSDYPSPYKYSTFIAGDNPYTTIKNEDVPKDGPKCIVIKESFGNAFVPFLVDHYRKIYVIDYRYWDGNIAELAREKGVDDIIFVNNISMTRGDYLTGKLSQVTK